MTTCIRRRFFVDGVRTGEYINTVESASSSLSMVYSSVVAICPPLTKKGVPNSTNRSNFQDEVFGEVSAGIVIFEPLIKDD